MKQYQPNAKEREQHYELEKELAAQLREADFSKRQKLYGEVYDKIYRSVPYLLPNQRYLSAIALKNNLSLLGRYLNKKTIYMEIGAGNCLLAMAVADRVKQVYAIDVSVEVTANQGFPSNFSLKISDGLNIPVDHESIDLAFSNQLMEHLHPEDASIQLQNIYNALRIGGRYICVTPNKFSGPHDISKYFSNTPAGFHLREYSCSDLISEFRKAGFRKFKLLQGSKGIFFEMPTWSVTILEKLLASLPPFLRRRLGRLLPFRLWLGLKLIAIK